MFDKQPNDPGRRAPHIVSQEHTLAGKLRRLRLFPVHTITARLGIAQLIHRFRTKRAEAELKKRGLNRLLSRLAPHALRQDPADLLFLFKTVIERKPLRVLELGSGQSTLFIAQALYELGQGHLWSLDADANWLEHTKESLPPELHSVVTLVHSPATVNAEYCCQAWEYSVVPEGDWDFVLVDGPALTSEVRMSSDLIRIAPKLRPGAIGMIDHRWRTAALAKEIVGDKLRFRYAPSLESYLFSPR